MKPRCSGVLVIVLFVAGCSAPTHSNAGGESLIKPRTHGGVVADKDTQLRLATDAIEKHQYEDAEQHLLTALTGCSTLSEFERVNAILATVYETQGKLEDSEARRRECVRCAQQGKSAINDRSVPYLRSLARVLYLMGRQRDSVVIEDEVQAYLFEKLEGDTNPKDVAPPPVTVAVDTPECARCRDLGAVIPIEYGVPDDRLLSQEAAGLIRVGGVVRASEKYFCKRCRKSW